MPDMNALAVTKFGKPARLIRRPIPEPGSGEVLLKVVAVGLNPYDFRARDLGLFVNPDSLPMVLGNDIAGIVTALGPENQGVDLKIGDLIFGQTNHAKQTADQSGLQEYCVLDAYATAKVPSGLTADHGASLPSNAVAAFWALFNPTALGLPPPFSTAASSTQPVAGTSIVIVGGGSNCGRYAVQFARLSGLFSTIVAIAGPKHAATLRSFGATHVVDRHGDESEIISRVRAIVGDDCMYVVDAVNHEHTLGVGCLSSSRKGRMATLCPGEADLTRIDEKKAGFYKAFSAGSSQNAPDLARKFWGALPGWLESGQVKALEWDVINGLDVDEINAVWDLYKDGKAPERQTRKTRTALKSPAGMRPNTRRVKQMMEKAKLAPRVRVLRDELYPTKADNTNHTAVLDEKSEIRVGAAEAFGQGNEATVAKIAEQGKAHIELLEM